MPVDSRNALIRRLAIASIAGQLAWLCVVVVGGIAEPGYSEIRDAVSVLGARDAARPWLFDIGVAIWGRSDLLALGSGLLGIAIFGALFFLIGNDVNGQYGLVQRLGLAAGGIWVAALAVGLLAIHGREHDPAVRLAEWVRTLPGGQLIVRPGGWQSTSSPLP